MFEVSYLLALGRCPQTSKLCCVDRRDVARMSGYSRKEARQRNEGTLHSTRTLDSGPDLGIAHWMAAVCRAMSTAEASGERREFEDDGKNTVLVID